MGTQTSSGQAAENVRCAVIGVMASVATTTVFIAGIILLFKYADLMINSVPKPRI